MKLIRKQLEKDKSGTVTLIPENPDDMWHTYNLIVVGDHVSASTSRKVQKENASGNVNTQKVRTTITISVETLDFDSEGSVLRLKGKNVAQNEYVKMGAYHTLDLELNRQFVLRKAEWDSIVLDRITMACDPAQHADVAAVVLQEGLAHICLITPNMTIVRAKITQHIRRKRRGHTAEREKGLAKYYETVGQTLLRNIDFDIVKCVIIASPGFAKDNLFKYLMDNAIKTENKTLLQNKSKFMLVHASSGFKTALKEVLADPSVIAQMANTKAVDEVQLLDNFFKTLQREPARAFYGMKQVQMAAEAEAIEHLLISDTLFRSQDVIKRKEYVKLVDSVKESGGKVSLFSSMHVTGEQLDRLTGVAALLRFPMPDLEDISPIEDADDDNDC